MTPNCSDGALPPDNCQKPTEGLFWNCEGQEALQQRYAAEYAALHGIASQYWVLRDQFERQRPGPVRNDPLYMEPMLPIRPEGSDKLAETWNFAGPLTIHVLITDRSSDREAGEAGSTKDTRYTLAVPVYSICSACKQQLGEDEAKTLGFFGTPRAGDVMFIGGRYREWVDIDVVGRRGYTTPDFQHVWFEIEAVRRTKYVPSRKDEIPNKSTHVPRSSADAGFQTGLPYRAVEDQKDDPLKEFE